MEWPHYILDESIQPELDLVMKWGPVSLMYEVPWPTLEISKLAKALLIQGARS